MRFHADRRPFTVRAQRPGGRAPILAGRRRQACEHALRSFAIGIIVFVAVYAFVGWGDTTAAISAGANPEAALQRWSTVQAPEQAHVRLDSAPTPLVRDWIAALRATGTRATWLGQLPPAAAIGVEPVADPHHPVQLWLATPNATRAVVRDTLGVIETLTTDRGGAVLTAPRIQGIAAAQLGGTRAASLRADSLLIKPVLVLGMTGWEAKFAIAALEEHGWQVDARLALAPSGDIRQHAESIRIDTVRYAAVIAIDSVAARYAAAVQRYVRTGGGFIAVGNAAGLPAFNDILPARAASPGPSSDFDEAGSQPRAALALSELQGMEPAAVALEKRGEDVAVAAQRVGQGRVVQVGYHETWRWRLAGMGADPVAAHRGWWSALVSAAAYAPRVPLHNLDQVEAMPRAAVIARIGMPVESPIAAAGLLQHPHLLTVLFVALLVALLAEWLSRRLRGAA